MYYSTLMLIIAILFAIIYMFFSEEKNENKYHTLYMVALFIHVLMIMIEQALKLNGMIIPEL